MLLRRGAARGLGQREQDDEGAEEAQRIGKERGLRAHGGDHHPGQRRADDAGPVKDGTVERHGGAQFFPGHELGEQGRVGRPLEGMGDAQRHGHGGQMPHRPRMVVNQAANQRREQALQRDHADQNFPAIGTIGDRAAPGIEERDHNHQGEADERLLHGSSRLLFHQELLRLGLHPRPDHGDEFRHHESRIHSIAEDAQGIAECGVLLFGH